MNFLEILQPFSEAATQDVPYKKLFLKILWYSQENNWGVVSFKPAILLKRDSNTGAFMWGSRKKNASEFSKSVF